MFRDIEIGLGDRSYLVRIAREVAHADVVARLDGLEVALITDEVVATLPWFPGLRRTLEAAATRFMCLEIPEGEPSKSFEQLARLCSALARRSFTRQSVVVGVGGGVVGDLAGFCAASYLRGVSMIHIPTTLLAMVDSSVGGKTGINLPEGKNLVGAFHQPQLVHIGLEALDSLPSRHYAAGMAEVIKYGMIQDPGILDMVESGVVADHEALVARCVEIKRDVVMADERETGGRRAILNFGHTLGHAIEQTSGYGECLHGEAISLGMVAACRLSEACAGLSPEVTRRLISIFRAYQLPVFRRGLEVGALREAISRDKKATMRGVRWILVPEPGQTQIRADIPWPVIERAIASLSEEPE